MTASFCLNGERTEDEVDMKTQEMWNYFICMLHLVVLSLFKQSELFCLEFEFFGAQPFWVRLSQLRTEKGSLVTYLVLLPYMPALFMTSLRYNPGHRMAALTVIFQRGTRKGVKNCCEYIFCNPYLPIEPVMLSSVRFS